MASIWTEFKEFAVKGNVVDMAVGIMIGAAFGTVVKSAVDDLVMPPIGLLTGGLDLSDQFVVLRAGTTPPPYDTLEAARATGAVLLTYGSFLNAVTSFLIVSVVLFLVVKWMNNLRSPDTPPAPNTRPCPYCRSVIHQSASRCPQCTSEIEPAVPAAT